MVVIVLGSSLGSPEICDFVAVPIVWVVLSGVGRVACVLFGVIKVLWFFFVGQRLVGFEDETVDV